MSIRKILFAMYTLVCVTALIWPGYDLTGNRIEPFILGLPFTLAWNVAWVVASFLALLLFHVTDPTRKSQ